MSKDIYIKSNLSRQNKFSQNNIDSNFKINYDNDSLLEKCMYSNLSEKYFNEIEEYNRDIVSFKRTFFQNVLIDDFKLLLNVLTYNTNFNTSNYRWGKRVFDKRYNKLSWISSTNKQIQKTYWSRLTHSLETYWKDIHFTDEMLKDHLLSCFKKNRKIGFYYNLSNSEKEELQDYNTALKNLYNINDKTYGSTQTIGTDVLLIDIDNYDERHSLDTLKKLLNYFHIKVKDLMVLEQNVFTGGLHTAIKLPHKITKEDFYPNLMKHLKDNEIFIECNFINNFLRFPLSFEYVAIKKDENIFDYNEFIPQNLWEQSFYEYLTNINLDVCPSDILNNMIIQTQIKEKSFNKWENYWKTVKQRFYKENNPNNLRKSFKIYNITCGHRYETMSKIIPMLKGLGYSLDDVVNKIMDANVDSKDLTKWTKSQLRDNIQSFYNKCDLTIDVKNRSYNGFISNIDKLSKETISFLSGEDFAHYITQKFIQFYIQERNKTMSLNSLSKEKKDILYKQIPYMIKEIIGYMVYQINNKKLTNISERIGFQLSDEYLTKLQNQSIIDLNLDSSNSLTKTSLQYLKKAIILSLSLKEINYKNRTRNWLNGSCKSYDIVSLNDLYELLIHLYNSMNKNTYNRLDNNIINNPPNILYISLRRKQGVEKNDDFNLLKKMIDIDDENEIINKKRNHW